MGNWVYLSFYSKRVAWGSDNSPNFRQWQTWTCRGAVMECRPRVLWSELQSGTIESRLLLLLISGRENFAYIHRHMAGKTWETLAACKVVQ